MNGSNWVSFTEKGVCLFCGSKDIMYKYFHINNSPLGIFSIANKLMINRKIITRCRVKDRILCFSCYERFIYCNNFIDNIQSSKKNPAEVTNDENKAICCVCRKAHDKPLKSISANGFVNNRELFLTTLLFDIKKIKEEKRIACKSCFNNMINLCNLHRLLNLNHPQLHSILNRTHLNDLKEDSSFRETIILDNTSTKSKAKDSMRIVAGNSSASTNYTNIDSSKSGTGGKENESNLSDNTDSITLDTSSSSISNIPILGGESKFDISHITSVPSYKFVRPKPPSTRIEVSEDIPNADIIITDRLYHIPKSLKFKHSQPKGTRISLPSHKEDEQSYEIQHILLSHAEIDVPNTRTPNRFVRFWRRLFKKNHS